MTYSNSIVENSKIRDLLISCGNVQVYWCMMIFVVSDNASLEVAWRACPRRGFDFTGRVRPCNLRGFHILKSRCYFRGGLGCHEDVHGRVLATSTTIRYMARSNLGV
jgi:hypothetical protein